MRHYINKYFPLIMLVAAIASGIGTYSAITKGADPLVVDQDGVFSWVLVNLILLLALALVISFRLVGVWLGRKRGSVGSRLQMRIVKRFGLVTIIPTIVLAVFSSLYFHFGIDAWFNDRVGTALNESVKVAEGYLAEHKKIITADILAMANDINKQAVVLSKSQRRFNRVVATQAVLRSLTEAVVFQGQNKNIVARTTLSFSLAFELENISLDNMKKAEDGEVVLLTSDNDDRVRALIKLVNYFDTYLLVGRLVDSNVLQHVELTKGSAAEYQKLRNDVSSLQVTFSILFGVVALLLLLASIWFGMMVSAEFVSPIGMLVKATESVKGGDFSTRVDEGPEDDEIGTLNRAFNRMTGQLEKQRSELIEVNRQIDERRRFIEAVLSGVSLGVIVLDRNKHITLMNRSAITLLDLDHKGLKNEDFISLYPDVQPIINKSVAIDDDFAQGDIVLPIGEKDKSFHVRIVAEKFSDEIEGYIVTFDDITELQSAQRRAAWADVARRVAHEIKNPLTPIQLASERLKRKYGGEIKNDKETFDNYIDTITRHVGDIRNIVEEFVEFARMPAPVFSDADLVRIVNDTAFSRECANPDIDYNLSLPDYPLIVNCDKAQLSQVFTNLIKNAAEAIEANEERQEKGQINITFKESKKTVKVVLEDNGVGFPEDLLDSITEPYVTTREKGTGLGLAIVKKILDDHGVKLELGNIKKGNKTMGASVSLAFPKSV